MDRSMAVEIIRTLRLYDESDLDEAVDYIVEVVERERRAALREMTERIRQVIATAGTGE